MIDVQTHPTVSILRLERPARANALTPELLDQLTGALDQLGQRGLPLIVTGSGAAFCAGADLKWLAAQGDPALAVAELVAALHATIGTLLDLRVPILAALNGAVAGSGLGLALAADYRVAADTAAFTAGYFVLGLTPDGGATAFLERTIGVPRAMDLLLTNRALSATEARDWGLVNEVVPGEALLARSIEHAERFVHVPGYALQETRRLFDLVGLRNQLQLEAVAIRTAARSPKFRVALDDFLAAQPD